MIREINCKGKSSIQFTPAASSSLKQLCRGVSQKSVLENFANFTEKLLCQSLFFIKLLKESLRHSFFSVNFAKFFISTFLIERLCTTASVISGDKKDHCVKNSRKPKFFSSLYFRFYQYLQSMKFSQTYSKPPDNIRKAKVF